MPATRVSDAEREEVALALRRACSEGRLTIDELSERLGLVYAARTRAELDATRADLPVERAPGVPAKRRRWLVSLIGGLCAREAVAPEHTIMVGLIGGTELDLSAAAFVAPVTTITSVQLIGGVSVKVPENAVVELSGFTLIGGNDNRVPAVSREPGTPIVRVRLFGLIGGSEARVKRRALPR